MNFPRKLDSVLRFRVVYKEWQTHGLLSCSGRQANLKTFKICPRREVELRITNLGRIREAKLDIRPLTIFVGPNHTNKTWTAYSLYGIARSLAHSSFSVRQPEVNHRDLSFGASAEWQAKIESIAEELFRTLSEAPGAQIKSIISRRDVIEGMDSSAVNHTGGPARGAPRRSSTVDIESARV
jgi:hypothetical protein